VTGLREATTPGTAPRRPADPRRRSRLAVAGLAAAALLLALVALGLGDYPLSVPEVVRALVSDQGFASTIVTQWRLPRVLVALVLGAALAVSGALFQSLTRNPLGSPDVIGFATGSYTGVLVVTTVLGAGTLGVSAGALVAGLLTALVVYLLAYRDGVQGFRLIVVGISVTGMLHGLNVWLLLRARTEVALAASIWGAGSISLVGWAQALPAFAALAVLTPRVWAVRGPLRQLELGDDAAGSHGLRVERARLAVVVLGVALIATVTATAGPIAFVALAAPQIARRLTGSAGLPLAASALTGALLLLGADLVAQHVLPTALPVGVVTVVLGGAYLLALIVREARRRW
jgi:iron complex transport system permease protein